MHSHAPRSTLGVCLAFALAACSDATRPERPALAALAAHLDSLKDLALATGNTDRGEALSTAVLALEAGADVADVTITDGGVAATYHAVVVDGGTLGGVPGIPPEHLQMLAAWQGADAERTVSITLDADSATLGITPPSSDSTLGLQLAGLAAFTDGDTTVYEAANGWAALTPGSVIGPCSTLVTSNATHACALTRFTTGFSIDFRPSRFGIRGLPDLDAPSRTLTMPKQTVNGPRFSQ